MVGFTVATLLVTLSVVSAHWVPGSHKGNESEHEFPECGATNPNGHTIDQTEPVDPPPFHDLTTHELRKVREYLENHPKIKAVKSSKATLNSSYIFSAELFLPNKQEVLNHLDKGGPKPQREAHVIMFRGDKETPVVEECVCGPLPDITKCKLLNRTSGKNPVDWNYRPPSRVEMRGLKEVLLKKVDEKAGDLLIESYGEKFTECEDEEKCLTASVAPVGSGVVKDKNKRRVWVTAAYNLQHQSLNVLNFAVLVNCNGTDPDEWQIEKAWYGEKTFESLEDLVSQYNNNSIPKTKVQKPANDENLFSSLRRRRDPMPPNPQRPPRLVEPDGKRYSVKDKRVEYMDWSFSYRLSAISGPAVYDVKFKGERVVYEFALAEWASFHSGHSPAVQTLDDIRSSSLIGTRSKGHVPGAGCPETATLLSAVFLNPVHEEPKVHKTALCLFENNDGHAVVRHLAYSKEEGGFYGAQMDTILTLRATFSKDGSDKVVDILFHRDGMMHGRLMSTGYIVTSFLASSEKPYGHRVHENSFGHIRQDMVHFKIDIDANGQFNRYETLDIKQEKVMATAFLDKPYSQTRINASLKTTEKEAVYDFDFSEPKYHIVHNNEKRNKYNEKRAYRIEVRDVAKSLLEEDLANEKSISWARHQIVVTKRKEEEASSSSIYALLDSQDPTVDFSKYYEDDEDIVDEDLVVWVTASKHHIPHSEDIPNEPTSGSHLDVFLLPHNTHDESPTVTSRDAIYIEYKDPKDPSKGVRVDRNGNSRDQCVIPKSTLEEDLEEDPDRILESRRK